MTKLYDHQKNIVEEFPERHALIWGTGTGKTLTALELAWKAQTHTLIICPKGQKTNWKEELESFMKGRTKEYDFGIFLRTKEEFRRDWKKLPGCQAVIVDEAHYFFGTSSQMMKSLRNYFKRHDSKYRWFLTATPYRSSPMDIRVMMELLGHKVNRTEFFNRFFYMVRMGRRMVPKVKAGIEEDVAELVQRVGSTVRLEDCVDVPQQVFETEWFSLTKKQEEAIHENFDPLPIVRFTKEHQICGGSLKGDEYVDSKFFPSDKADRLIELAKENDRMIVVCRYNHEIGFLKDKLSAFQKTTCVINGDVSGKDRHLILEELSERDSYVLLVNAAVSEGWELPKCPLMVFYSYSFSLKDYVQMCGRIQRINNIKKNVYLSLVVKNSIDNEVYNAIQRKEDFHIALYAKAQST